MNSKRLIDSKLRNILAITGVVMVVALILAIGFVGYMVYQGRELDASSKQYVDRSVPLIVSGWSKNELLKRSAPQLMNLINEKPEQIDRLFEGYAKLGALRSYDGATGDSNVSYTNQNGKVISAAYVVNATFEHGRASISVKLVRNSNSWQYLRFNVNSPLFSP